jgi:hypothetical protein
LAIAFQSGKAITFEVENPNFTPNTRKFFEVYRTPDPGVGN